MKKSIISNTCVFLYRFKILRGSLRFLLRKLEGGDLTSISLRIILLKFYGITIGNYSYGECMKPGAWPAGVVVGNYVSVAENVRIFLRNHPYERISTHPFFYNSQLGIVPHDTIVTGCLEIGHDAWIGHSAAILPGCSRIGIGAVIGAGSIITKDVPDFAIVAGNPGKIIKYRFTKEHQDKILNSKWWELPIHSLEVYLESFVKPVSHVKTEHFELFR